MTKIGLIEKSHILKFCNAAIDVDFFLVSTLQFNAMEKKLRALQFAMRCNCHP